MLTGGGADGGTGGSQREGCGRALGALSSPRLAKRKGSITAAGQSSVEIWPVAKPVQLKDALATDSLFFVVFP